MARDERDHGMSLLAAFEPIWLLAGAGYLARRFGLLGDGADQVLGRFVFHLAMPAALFLTLSTMPLTHLANRGLLAFAGSTALVIGAGWLIAGRRFHRKPAERPIWGMAAGYVNSANLGIPIASQVLGSISFLAEVVLLQVLLVSPIVLIALDRQAAGVRVRRIALIPLRNPVILASLLGVGCSAAGLSAPGFMTGSLRMLAAAAVPVALVALGASLRSTGEPAGARGELGTLCLLKLVAQPAVAYLTGLLLGLSGHQLLAVVVCAGLPTAQNTFIYAQEYRVASPLIGRAVLASTSLSLVTLAGTAALLGR